MKKTNDPGMEQETKKEISDIERLGPGDAKKTKADDVAAMFQYTEGADCTFKRKE